MLPTIISSEMARKTILATINDAAPGHLDFTDLSIGWFKGVSISNINYQDDMESIRVKVKQFAAKLHFGSIIFGKISFGDTIIDEPIISIDLKEIPQPNIPSQMQQPTPTLQSQPMVALPVHQIDLNINNGRFTVTDSKGNSAQLAQINSNLNLRPPGQQTNFDFATNLSSQNQESKITAKAQVTPDKKTGWSLEGSTGDLSIEIQDLDLTSLEPFFAMAGLQLQAAGTLAANFKSKIDQGLPKTINGTIKGANLKLTGNVLKGDKISTSDLNVDIQVQRENELINIQNCVVHTDWANLTAAGFIPTTIDSLDGFFKPDSQYNLKGNCQINLADILSQIPQTLGMKEGMTISSGKLSADFAASQAKIASTASLTGLSGQIDGKTIALSQPLTLETAVTASDSIISFEKAAIGSSFASINLAGTSRQANYQADIDLAKLQTELGQFMDMGDYNFAGQIASTGQVATAENMISATSSSTIKNLQISAPQKPPLLEPEVGLDVSLNYDTSAQNLKIDNAALKTSFASINTQQSSLSLAETQPAINLPLVININLEKLQPILAFFSSSDQKMQLAGIAESKISVTSQNNNYRIFVDQTRISDLAVSYPGKETFRQEKLTLDLDAEVNPELKTAFVKNIRLQSPQINIQGDFQKTESNGNTELKGKANLDYDWTAISTLTAPYLPEGLNIQGKRKDTIGFDSVYPTEQPEKLMANLNAQGKIGFDNAEYMGLNIDTTELNINAQKGLLKINVPPTTVNNGKLAFAGELDFTQTPALFKVPEPTDILKDVQINDQMTKSILMYLNPIFANAINVTGVANFSCDHLYLPLAAENKNDIEIDGSIGIDNLRLQAAGLLDQILSVIGMDSFGQTLKIHQTKFNLLNGILKYNPSMQIDIGKRPLVFTGSIGLDNSLKMNVALPITLEGENIKVDEETTGEPVIIPLEGTVNRPKIDTTQLFTDQVKEQLEQIIFNELDKLFE
jgi:hypothetical protein